MGSACRCMQSGSRRAGFYGRHKDRRHADPRIPAQRLLNQQSQALHPATHIGPADRQPDPHLARNRDHQTPSARVHGGGGGASVRCAISLIYKWRLHHRRRQCRRCGQRNPQPHLAGDLQLDHRWWRRRPRSGDRLIGNHDNFGKARLAGSHRAAADGTVSISPAQLAYMLDGIDWRNPRSAKLRTQPAAA